MKFIKLYEDFEKFNIEGYTKNELNYFFDNLRGNIAVTEDDEYIILHLGEVFLTSSRLKILDEILTNKTVIFYCETHVYNIGDMETEEEIRVSGVSRAESKNGRLLVIYGDDKRDHQVEINYPIKISKFEMKLNKYNI